MSNTSQPWTPGATLCANAKCGLAIAVGETACLDTKRQQWYHYPCAPCAKDYGVRQMSETKQLLTKPATFPLPKSHALVCPMGCGWKMEPYKLAGIRGYRCLGVKPLRKLPVCGHFISDAEAKSLIGMEMMEE